MTSYAYLKGAPQRVLELCDRVHAGGVERPLDETTRTRWMRLNHAMSANGLRVLAVAYGRVERADEAALTGLTMVGLIGMADPPAAGVPETIQTFQAAGIRTVMITGDQAGTARAVARELGLTNADVAIDGRDIDALSDTDLDARVGSIGVFSRVSPAAKLRIVAAYQRIGEGSCSICSCNLAEILVLLGAGVSSAGMIQSRGFESRQEDPVPSFARSWDTPSSLRRRCSPASS